MMVRVWIIASSEDRDPTRTTEGRESDVAVQKSNNILLRAMSKVSSCNIRYIIILTNQRAAKPEV